MRSFGASADFEAMSRQLTLMPDAKRFTVISGPSCVGKSMVMGGVKTEPAVRAQFRLDGIPSWIVNPGHSEMLFESRLGRTFMTYDHNMLWVRRCAYEEDRVLKELKTADVVFVTMWEQPEVLLHRCDERIRAALLKLRGIRRGRERVRRFRKHFYKLRIHLRMRSLYARPSALWLQFCKWFEFCDRCNPVEHWTLKGTGPPRLVQLSGWSPSKPLWNRAPGS